MMTGASVGKVGRGPELVLGKDVKLWVGCECRGERTVRRPRTLEDVGIAGGSNGSRARRERVEGCEEETGSVVKKESLWMAIYKRLCGKR